MDTARDDTSTSKLLHNTNDGGSDNDNTDSSATPRNIPSPAATTSSMRDTGDLAVHPRLLSPTPRSPASQITEGNDEFTIGQSKRAFQYIRAPQHKHRRKMEGPDRQVPASRPQLPHIRPRGPHSHRLQFPQWRREPNQDKGSNHSIP